MNPPSETWDVVVVGGGAGGMLAAGRSAETGAKTLLLEKTDGLAKKLLLSGNYRCNITNVKTLEEFLPRYGPNGAFLRNAFHRFFREQLLELLGRYGVATKAEPDGKIFPATDSSRDVVAAFSQYLQDNHVTVRLNSKVVELVVENGHIAGVRVGQELLSCRAVILATGGASYPGTGSTGDGCRLAGALGHRIVPQRPALVPLTFKEEALARSMQGVAFVRARCNIYQATTGALAQVPLNSRDYHRGVGKKPSAPLLESRVGEILFTHNGLSGPTGLLCSLTAIDALKRGPVSMMIDFFPDLDEKQLQKFLQQNFEKFSKRALKRILEALLPPKAVSALVEKFALPGDLPGTQIVAAERDRLARALKTLAFNVSGSLPMEVAIVTAGGVSLDEVRPRDFSSRLVGGLYFCGETLDIDGETGGYNLQAAFSTGYVAGESAAQNNVGENNI